MSQKSVEFFVRCVPPKATAQQKGAFYNHALGRVIHFKKKNVVESENDYMTLLAPHVPKEPFRGAVRFEAIFVWPFRKSESQKTRKRLLVPMTVKPDFDNLSKTLCDTMTKLCFWTDDSLVSDGRVRKFWGERSGIHIRVEEIAWADASGGIDGNALALLGVSGMGDLFGGKK